MVSVETTEHPSNSARWFVHHLGPRIRRGSSSPQQKIHIPQVWDKMIHRNNRPSIQRPEGIWNCLLGLNEAELMLKLLETERINNMCQHHPVPKSDFRFKNNMKCGFDRAKRYAFWYFNYCHVYTLVIKQSHCHIASYNRTSRTTPAKRTSRLELYI